MRLITAFLIILAFPWIFRMDNDTNTNSEFCVAGMGYCLLYNSAVFSDPERESDNYGGAIHSQTNEINGQFSAVIDPMKETFEQQYLAIMSGLESADPDLEQLNSMIADDFYYLSVQTNDQMHYYQAWRRDNRLVQLELHANAGIDPAIWEEATGGFGVNWR